MRLICLVCCYKMLKGRELMQIYLSLRGACMRLICLVHYCELFFKSYKGKYVGIILTVCYNSDHL